MNQRADGFRIIFTEMCASDKNVNALIRDVLEALLETTYDLEQLDKLDEISDVAMWVAHMYQNSVLEGVDKENVCRALNKLFPELNTTRKEQS